MAIRVFCIKFRKTTNNKCIMRRFLWGVVLIFLASGIQAQSSKIKNGKYPSLLWEITGNGAKKPSYLFGTMHVSSKMVFNLSDSFYLAIRNADVVALETNPESWQEDMFNFNVDNAYSNPFSSGYRNAPEEYLTINTLKKQKYEGLLEAALASNPSMINNLLYRTYSERNNDFEEDTYLDLYIFQIGKKWGKKVLGVERYAESMRLAMEAYMDAMKDKNKKEKSFDLDDDFSYSKLQDAYRTGNLDLLDTINKVNSLSPAFDEKFLYKRNDIQAESIDSILRNHQTLFVGVGAAHLPGERGVIEILRRKGYKLRPVKMGLRNSLFKENIEKLKVPVVFGKQASSDGFYKVDVPGKLYKFNNNYSGFDQVQYADMANGSYYIVTRVQTNALQWGHDADAVSKKIDSLLYENIPGKILSKTSITKNGYKGYAITNRTRRGDLQRYNIFLTPFEVIFFKVSGTADYIKESGIADKFFNSIELKDFPTQWKKFSPAFGGFEVDLPHEPYMLKNGNWQFFAVDKAANVDFQILRTDVHNYNFVEEDSFDLSILEESFTSSEYFDKSLSRKQSLFKGYPVLDASYKYKDGSVAMVRYLVQGAHYYTLVAHGNREHPKMTQFLNSFAITPFIYGKAQKQTDTALYFTVNTTYYPATKNSFELPSGFEKIYTGAMDEDETSLIETTVFKEKVIANDTTGEKIYVSFYKSPKYQYLKDSLNMRKGDRFLANDYDWVVKTKSKTENKDGSKVWEYMLTDTASSRSIWTKAFYKNGVGYSIRTETDTLTKPSSFLSGFFNSFQPSDTVKGINPYTKKSSVYFNDFFSSDTMARKKAIQSISLVNFDEEDSEQLQKAIQSLSWKDKNYISVKRSFIEKFGDLKDQKTSLFLKNLYYAAGDTIDLQYATLNTLLDQETKFSYNVFKDILMNEPPVLNVNSNNSGDSYGDESFMDQLYDSLKLTSSIIKDIMPLITVKDYEYPMMQLLSTLVDSNLIAAKDYELYVPKFLIEAKQAWKKQAIAEKNKAIGKAQKKDDDIDNESEGKDYGNEDLNLYSSLLMPLWDKNPAVPQLLNQILNSNDKQLMYNTALLFIRNGKKVSDSILQAIASSDDYRYDLYVDLLQLQNQNLFPSKYNNQLDLAKSKLLSRVEYEKPDTVAFLQKLPVKWQGKDAHIYFFKYKTKKDDSNWKLATAGLVPADSSKFELDESVAGVYDDDADFTELSNAKLDDSLPIADQLEKHKKQLMYSKRKSAKKFYRDADDIDFTSTIKGMAK